MKVITGDEFNTTNGKMVVYNEQEQAFSVGEKVDFNGVIYSILEMIPPTRPNGKWSVKLGIG